MRLLGPKNCQQPLSSEAEMNLFSKAHKLNLLLWLSSLHHLLPLSLPEINVLEIENKQAFEIFSPIWVQLIMSPAILRLKTKTPALGLLQKETCY